jgi:hypothetical protein
MESSGQSSQNRDEHTSEKDGDLNNGIDRPSCTIDTPHTVSHHRI